MSKEQNCRQAFDDFYHKIKAEVSYDHWCAIWRFISKRQARGEPVLYQSRTRPIWIGASKTWTAWKNCTKDQANDYRRVKVLHDWEYEVRELYTAPQPQQIPYGYKLVPVEPTEEMMRAGCQVPLNKAARHNLVYKAMLEAAPEVNP
jgi:hypothetical protein